jgi:hypothetical protein
MEKSILLLGPSVPWSNSGRSKASDCIEAVVLPSPTVLARSFTPRRRHGHTTYTL